MKILITIMKYAFIFFTYLFLDGFVLPKLISAPSDSSVLGGIAIIIASIYSLIMVVKNALTTKEKTSQSISLK